MKKLNIFKFFKDNINLKGEKHSMVNLSLETTDVDLILNLVSNKIEKAKRKEIDEIQIVYLKQLESLKNEIECQISYVAEN